MTEPERPETKGPSRTGTALGCLGVGCGGMAIGLTILMGSLLLLLGDLMSGGQVPGHGQSAINSSISGVNTGAELFALAILVALVGGIIWFGRRDKK